MNWIQVKLTDVSNPKQWKQLSTSELTEIGYDVYGANGIIGKYTEFNHEQPTLAITCRGATCGSLHITKPKSYITGNAMALDSLSSNVDMNFLYYALKRRGFNDIVSGSAQPQITRQGLSKVTVEIPEKLEDQIRIATILSKVEALIKQRKESIDLLDEYLKSTFLEMFGAGDKSNYPIKTLNEVSIKITDGEHGTVERLDQGRLYLMARNITRSNELDFEQVSYISEDAHQKIYKRCNPQKDDLLMVCVGATIGKVALVPEMEEFSIARSVALIKPNHKLIDSRYLLWFFNTDFGIRQIKSRSNEAAQAGLYTGNLKKIKIPLPPIEIQQKFTTIVKKAEQINTQYQSSLAELENLYGSLSQKAFKGELNVSKIDQLLESEYSSEDNDRVEPKKENHTINIREELEKFNQASLNLDDTKSLWLQTRNLGIFEDYDFTNIEGEAVLLEIFKDKKGGFNFEEFCGFLKNEKIKFNYQQVKEFVFEQLNKSKLIQFYASKEWMISGSRMVNQLQDDFAGEGNIWFLVNHSNHK